EDRVAAVPCLAGLQADPRAARRRAGEEAARVPVQQPLEPDRHGLFEGRDLRARRRHREAPGYLGDHRRHLQPHDLRRRRLPQFLARPPGTARPGDLHRLAVQDLRHARLARRLHGRPRVRGQGRGDDELQPHHQPARGDHRGRGRGAVGPAGRAGRQARRVRGQARPGDGGVRRHPGRDLPAPARRVLRVPGHQRVLRQDPRPHRPAHRQRRGLLQRAAGSQGRGLRARVRVRRAARAAHQLHLPDAATRARPRAHPRVLLRTRLTELARPRRPHPRHGVRPMKSPVRVAVTGAAGQIGYALLFRIAAGGMRGKDQPVILQMLELPLEKAQAALKGVMMELEDCAFPLLAGMVGTDDPRVAFKDADVALLVGARPRGPGMERKDLLLENAKIFTGQGKALNEVASRDVKVLVVGNPANTNAYIAMKSAPDLPAKNFTAMLRLDHNRALSQLANKACVPVGDIEKLIVWGNHSPTMYPDYRFATANGTSLKDVINDADWNENVFIPQVGKRGAAIIEARGLSSAASAANAAIDHVRVCVLGSDGKWVTMGVPSDGSYGIPEGIIYGVPVTTKDGEYTRVEGLVIVDISRARMDRTLAELE